MKSEQLSFWSNPENIVKLVSVEKHDQNLIIIFETETEKGLTLEVIFNFEKSPENFTIEKNVIRAPEGIRAFHSSSSREELTWIRKKIYLQILKKARAIASDYFRKAEDKTSDEGGQLNLFENS